MHWAKHLLIVKANDYNLQDRRMLLRKQCITPLRATIQDDRYLGQAAVQSGKAGVYAVLPFTESGF